VIHKQSIPGFGLDPETATGEKFDIEFAGGVQWLGIPVRVEKVPQLSALTMQYANELKEVPIIGKVGPLAINSNVIELDLHSQLLRAMGIASEAANAAEMPYEITPQGLVFNGVGPGDKPLKAVLATRTEDLILDASFLPAARSAGTRPNVLQVGKVLFGDLAAIRFKNLRDEWSESVNAVIGAEALQNCAVTLWPKRKMIAFVAHPAPPFPDAEQAYFFALADQDAEGVAKFISSNPRRRLMNEACLELWAMRLADPKSTLDALKAALDTVVTHYQADRRSAALVQVADDFEKSSHPNREELAVYALQLAVKESGSAIQSTAAHEAHLRLGQRAISRGDLTLARRYLLSAAFGMPKDGKCNFWLGELYGQSGALRRAWSRYFQTTLDMKLNKPTGEDPIRVQAKERLDTLNADPEFRKIFDMITAEEYMAGRLADAEFHANSRYRFVKSRHPGHVKLVEFFVNSSDKSTGGMELAFQALDEFFEGDVALLAYHLDDSMHSPAARDRLNYYKKNSSPFAIFDGKPVLDAVAPGGETIAENAAVNYVAFQDASLRKTADSNSAWEFDGAMTRNDAGVDLVLKVTGTGATDGLQFHVILCERSVMAILANGVYFHHFVARDILTPRDGVALKGVLEKSLTFTIDTTKLSQELALIDTPALGQELAKFTKSQPRVQYVDADMLQAVAVVQRSADGMVLSVKTFALPLKEDAP
jgi:hypothetical protein